MTLEQDIQFALEHDEAIEYKNMKTRYLQILQLKTLSLNRSFNKLQIYELQF